MAQQRILLTGMSGTGKSSVIDALRQRGVAAVDMDEPGWSTCNELGHQLWHEERLQHWLDEHAGQTLAVGGCAENQRRFYPQFDHIVLLSSPSAVIRRRLAERTNNPYGKRPAEQAEVMANLKKIEPLLRRRATHEIVTTMPLADVVAEVLALLTGGSDVCDGRS